MGSQISAQSSEDVQESLNSIINKSITNINNRVNQAGAIDQKIVINMGDVTLLDGARISAKQSANVQMKALSELAADTSTQVSQDIESQFDVEKEIDTVMEQEGIILFQSQISLQKSVTKQSFSNTIEDIVETTISDMVSQQGSSNQELVFNMGNVTLSGKGTVWEVSQESIIDMLSETIANTMVDKIIDMKVVQTASASTKMTATLSQEGISAFGLALLLLVPIIAFCLLGYTVTKAGASVLMALFTILPILLIVFGVFSLFQYNSAVYYYCINDPNSEHYIETDLAKNDKVYINPNFAKISQQTCETSSLDPCRLDMNASQLENCCLPCPEGFGDPETAYLIKSKQEEYDKLVEELNDENANESDIKGKISDLSENKDNWMCVNGSDPQNDPSRSDAKILWLISAKSWNTGISVGMISAGVLILIAIIAYVAMSRKSNNTSPTTTTYMSPATPSIQGGAKKLYKSWSKSLNKLLKTKIF